MMKPTIEHSELKRCDLLKLSGRFDSSQAPRLETQFGELMNHGRYHFVLDLSDLEFASSAILRTLLATRKQAHRWNRGDIYLAAAHAAADAAAQAAMNAAAQATAEAASQAAVQAAAQMAAQAAAQQAAQMAADSAMLAAGQVATQAAVQTAAAAAAQAAADAAAQAAAATAANAAMNAAVMNTLAARTYMA